MSSLKIRQIAALLVLGIAIAGCSSQNAGSLIDPETGKHPAAWYSEHGAAFLKDQGACTECHGADLKGGISGVSCFSASFAGMACHAGGPSSHPLGWPSPDLHGAAAKAAPDAFATKGLASCQVCHGSPLSGGLAATTCMNTAGCHGAATAAPHSPAPWRGTTRTHITTDPGNAPACAVCHLGNRTPASYAPLPAGTQAGCFNSTLCHGATGHAAGWNAATQHGLTAEQDFSACKSCHGAAYQGGIAVTTCYQCHNGPGLDHPSASWVVSNHRTAALANSIACQKCHGADYLGGGSHIACTGCHMQDQTKVHRLNWYPDVRLNHRAYASANGTASCATRYCHGANLTGVTNSGPSCSTCHTWPFTGGGACGSCHGIPPDGTAFPDNAGRHVVHTGLANVTCDTCHTGAGSGTADHQDGAADVVIAAAYNARTGAASFNATARTCAAVSCHGGQTTPGFLTGSIDVNAQCTACHAAGTTQHNGFSSGRHNLHVTSKGFACTECHDTAKLAAVHFNDLNTTAMTEDWKTLLNTLNYTGTGTGSGNCTVTCHSKNHNPETW